MATPTYVALGTITLASTDSEIVFSSIPATYRDLVLVVAGGVSTNQNCFIYMNSDTTASNYSKVEAGGDGSSPFSGSSNSALWFTMTTSGANTLVQIMDYSATDKHKTALVRVNYISAVYMLAGRWANNTAVNTLTVKTSTGTFNVGTTFSLYGIAA